jgi:hypothetical protein
MKFNSATESESIQPTETYQYLTTRMVARYTAILKFQFQLKSGKMGHYTDWECNRIWGNKMRIWTLVTDNSYGQYENTFELLISSTDKEEGIYKLKYTRISVDDITGREVTYKNVGEIVYFQMNLNFTVYMDVIKKVTYIPTTTSTPTAIHYTTGTGDLTESSSAPPGTMDIGTIFIYIGIVVLIVIGVIGIVYYGIKGRLRKSKPEL